MQTVLPSSLDMASAQVLGFDATAYINNEPSTLHERLNIPNTINQSDYFMSNKAQAPKKKKSDALPVFLASALTLAGGAVLGTKVLKGKIKLPDNIKIKLLDTGIKALNFGESVLKRVKNSLGNLCNFITKHFKKIK